MKIIAVRKFMPHHFFAVSIYYPEAIFFQIKDPLTPSLCSHQNFKS